MAYKTDQSGFSWGLTSKELEAWRKRIEKQNRSTPTHKLQGWDTSYTSAAEAEVFERLRKKHIEKIKRQISNLEEKGLITSSNLKNVDPGNLHNLSLQQINEILNKSDYRSTIAKDSWTKREQKKYEAFRDYKSKYEYKGLRTGQGSHERFTSIMDMLSKSERDFIRSTYSSGDILEAAEEIVDKKPDKYIKKEEIRSYIEDIIKQRKVSDKGIDWDNPT